MTDDAVQRFRAAWREAPPETVEWLTPQTTGDRRPWSADGRVFRSFAETFLDVLAWYKSDLVERLRPFGLTLDPVIVERVSAAVRRL